VPYVSLTWGKPKAVIYAVTTMSFGSTFATVNLLLFALNTICF
jgi:hypothetical protein